MIVNSVTHNILTIKFYLDRHNNYIFTIKKVTHAIQIKFVYKLSDFRTIALTKSYRMELAAQLTFSQ